MTVQHIVMLEFNQDVSNDERIKALKAVEALKDKIKGIENIQSGKDFSGRGGNYTHAIIVTMRDKKVLASYGPHPAHKEVKEMLHPIVCNLGVIDFEPN
tara:strand:+ start:82 stop:378 length:297 start_codon:yes stop_codon:yes gene_type:complete